ncbi:MAG TPA: ubiquitin-like domain-containing protein [Gemmatimonadales bacterium]
MTAVGERYAVRVMVTPAWEQVPVQVDDATTVAQLKHQALKAALKTTENEQSFVVKFRGAQVLDESTTMRALGAVPNAPFIVLPGRRQPVR